VEPAPDNPDAAVATARADDALMIAIQQRDDSALADLYDRYGRLAFALAYRLLGDSATAEDVVQEAFLNVWRRASSFQPGRSGGAKPWLLSIVHNLAIDRRRGRFRRESEHVPIDTLTYSLQDDAEDPFSAVAETIAAEQVQTAMTTLSADQREAVELAYFGGLTHQEIAERTGAPLGTVKGRLRLGLHKLRDALEDMSGTVETERGAHGA
jgi:RNA polymerase sigma-70 factor (ECF subfamily)